ncbi:hypothetical protein DFH06DRAFT_1151230 [Mycena polygramma]|nr:hypothetical protein DFH06DRAFT_1151230 [Mycena polygramma]
MAIPPLQACVASVFSVVTQCMRDVFDPRRGGDASDTGKIEMEEKIKEARCMCRNESAQPSLPDCWCMAVAADSEKSPERRSHALIALAPSKGASPWTQGRRHTKEERGGGGRKEVNRTPKNQMRFGASSFSIERGVYTCRAELGGSKRTPKEEKREKKAT